MIIAIVLVDLTKMIISYEFNPPVYILVTRITRDFLLPFPISGPEQSCGIRLPSSLSEKALS